MLVVIFYHILFYDLWFYLSHVVLHHPRVYYIHATHHMKPYGQLIYLDTNEGHIIEHVVQPLGLFVPCYCYGLFTNAFLIAYLIIAMRAFMRHDHRFTWLIGNHHILHHKYRQYNYGEYWIDKLAGTCCPYKNEYIYGIIYT